LGEVHYAGEGPHWTVVASKKKKKEEEEEEKNCRRRYFGKVGHVITSVPAALLWCPFSYSNFKK